MRLHTFLAHWISYSRKAALSGIRTCSSTSKWEDCDKRESTYILDNKGVRSLTFREEDRIWELDNDLKCCALVNLGEHLASAPTVFYPTSIRKGRVVMAASPNEKHWAGFLKELPPMTYVMPTWKWGPLYMARRVKRSSHLIVTYSQCPFQLTCRKENQFERSGC